MIDTKQKRMSAINPGCPWRGPMVDAEDADFGVGNRQAAAFMYSGIEASDAELPFLVYDIEQLQLFSPGMVIGAGKVVPL